MKRGKAGRRRVEQLDQHLAVVGGQADDRVSLGEAEFEPVCKRVLSEHPNEQLYVLAEDGLSGEHYLEDGGPLGSWGRGGAVAGVANPQTELSLLRRRASSAQVEAHHLHSATIALVGRPWCLLQRADREREREAGGRQQACELPAVMQRLGHHRVGKHREDGAAGEGENIGALGRASTGMPVDQLLGAEEYDCPESRPTATPPSPADVSNASCTSSYATALDRTPAPKAMTSPTTRRINVTRSATAPPTRSDAPANVPHTNASPMRARAYRRARVTQAPTRQG